MKAVAVTRSLPISDPQSLIDITLPEPTPSGRDLLVEVRAVSVNPVDTKVRRREPPPESPRVLGWDAAGVVVAVGPDVALFKKGDAVYYAGDITRPGTNSELHLVDERIVGRMPRSLDFGQAAALPLTTLTAYEALFDRLHMQKGEQSRGKTLLIIGGAGGVGSIAIQLGKTLTAATVIATASRPETIKWVQSLGADHTIDHREALLPQLQALGIPSVDYIFCTANTDPYFATLSQIVAPQGAMCFIVETKAPVDIGPLQRKSATISWELMYTRSIFKTADMVEQHRTLNEVADLIDAGRIRTTMTERIGTINALGLRTAHARIEGGQTIGKLVLEGWS